MVKISKKISDREYYFFALRIAGDFGVTIAIPAVLAALLGQYLDEKYNTMPWLLIICLIIAFAVTIRIIYKKVKKYGEEYQKLK